jgi:flavin reductase (DIM6/NTAB) family NADH-FMN oxidoreductase RutF
MPIDDHVFREVMSLFASGVAIVTASDRQGTPKGLTTRSFVSVAADPPLVLVSIDRTSRTLPAIRASGAFVVNFLRGDRAALSDLFASKAEDKFKGLTWVGSDVAKGAPILADDSVGYAECVVREEISAGDHFLFMAIVEGGRAFGGRPLMYFRRSYAEWPRTG